MLVDHYGYAEGFLATGAILLLAALAWLPARESLPARSVPGVVREGE